MKVSNNDKFYLKIAERFVKNSMLKFEKQKWKFSRKISQFDFSGPTAISSFSVFVCYMKTTKDKKME